MLRSLLLLTLLAGELLAGHRVYLPVRVAGDPGRAKAGPAAVRFGVPLPATSGVRDVRELVLSGATAFRLRPLVRRESGAIEWVGVEALVDLPAGAGGRELVVTTGAGEPEGPPLVEGAALPAVLRWEHVSGTSGFLLAAGVRSQADLEVLGGRSDGPALALTALLGGRADEALSRLQSTGDDSLEALWMLARLTKDERDVAKAWQKALDAPVDPRAGFLQGPAGGPDVEGSRRLLEALTLFDSLAGGPREKDRLLDLQDALAGFLGVPGPEGWKDLPVSVEPRGSRTELAFVVPEGARMVRLKLADRPIEATLGFDAKTGSFLKDPARHVPFFAGQTVPVPRERLHGAVRQPIPGSGSIHAAARYLPAVEGSAGSVSYRPTEEGEASWGLTAVMVLPALAGLAWWIWRRRRRRS